jgi:hypothetical protein
MYLLDLDDGNRSEQIEAVIFGRHLVFLRGRQNPSTTRQWKQFFAVNEGN